MYIKNKVKNKNMYMYYRQKYKLKNKIIKNMYIFFLEYNG